MAKNTTIKTTSTTAKIQSISAGLAFVFITLLAFLQYGNSLSNAFSLDDELITTTDRSHHKIVEKGLSGIPEIFASSYAHDGKQNYEYRPMVTLSYALEWELFKDSPNRASISHFINVLLYALCGFLLFRLLMQFFEQKASWFSFIVVALFMLHPIHSEVVNNLKNRDELMSFAFAMMTAIQTFKWFDTKKWKYIALGIFTMILSILSKKSNLPLIYILPVMLYFFREVKWKQLGYTVLLLGLAQFGASMVKTIFLKESSLRIFSYYENPLFEMGFVDRIPMYFFSNVFYLYKLLIPYPLTSYYGFNTLPLVGFGHYLFFISFALCLVALYFIIKGLKSKSEWSFALLFFFMAIGGTANLLTPMVGIVSERAAFTASIGFSFGLAALLFHFFKFKKEDNPLSPNKIMLVAFALCIPGLLYSWQRNKDWKNKTTLFLKDAETTPKSVKLLTLAALEYHNEAEMMKRNLPFITPELQVKVDSAMVLYNRALSVFWKYESNLNNSGAIYYAYYFDFPKSIERFKASVSFNEKYTEGYLNIANGYSKLAEGYHEAIPFLPAVKRSKQVNKKLDAFFRNENLFKSFNLLRQYQISAEQLLKKGMNQQTIQLLKTYAQQVEQQDQNLKQIAFSAKIDGTIKEIMERKRQPDLQVLNEVRNQLVVITQKQLQLSPEQFAADVKELKRRYIDSSAVYYNLTYSKSPKMEEYYASVNRFAMLLQDYKGLLDLQFKYLKHFKKKYNAPTYIQMANCYFNLGNREKAKFYFKKGMDEMGEEMQQLQTKKAPTNEEKARILALQDEMLRLRSYVASIKAGLVPMPVVEE